MNAKKPAAIFVRHAETAENKGEPGPDLVKGNKDVPLDAHGIAHSKLIGKAIAKFKPKVVLTSPLQRAAHVGKEIGKRSGAPVRVQKNLEPPDFGSWTGKPAETHEPKIKRAFLEHPDKPIAGGDAPNDWLRRTASGVQAAVRQGKRNGPVVVVTHSRNLRELKHSLYGAPVADPTAGGPEPGQYITLSRGGKLSAPKGK